MVEKNERVIFDNVLEKRKVYHDLTELSKTKEEAKERFQKLFELAVKGEEISSKRTIENVSILAKRISQRLPKGKTAAEIIREVREEEEYR